MAKSKKKPYQPLTDEQIAKFKALIASGMQFEEARQSLEIPIERNRERLKKAAKEAEIELRLEAFEALRQHIRNNATAAVFAAKVKLNWQDKQVIESNQVVEYVDVPTNETRQQWEARQAKLRLVK